MESRKVELSEQSKAVFNVVTNDQKTYRSMLVQLNKYKSDLKWKEFKARMKHPINSCLNKEASSLVLDDRVITKNNPKTYKAYNACENQLDHLCNTLLHYYSQEVFGFEFRQWCDQDNPPPTAKDAYQDNATEYAKQIKQEKQPMKSIIKIENKTLVNGVDVDTMTDDTIFDQIATSEVEIARLEAIKTKPKKLTARIKEIQDGIDNLVKIVDGRK